MQIIQKVLSLQAIRDGVIEAVLDHESGTMQSKDTSDVYSTRLESILVSVKRVQWFSFLREPQIAFNQRIEFCLDLHNHSVKVMNLPQAPRLLILDLPGDEVPPEVLQQGA